VSNAPIERVAIADWHLHLPTAEYARGCPQADIACGCPGPGRLIVVHTAPKPTDRHGRLSERRCRLESLSRTPRVLKENSTHV
jgi:hypothetical protein